ncbi:MAG: lipoyl(octanoyl) transferase [Pelagibacteraceae bacterium TMED259]|nr:MAG: lipoyl(octanoyl) transferase [Pelagibacteraceae bacterium TMED259]
MSKIKQLKGYVNYSEILDKMEKTVKKVSENIKYEEIWFLEHKEVFTAGSSTPKEFNEEKINNIEVHKVNRGGKITYHGPGQLIIYPLINIKARNMNIIDYINVIEDICIGVFNNNQIELIRKKEKNRGLWVKGAKGSRKIIFIGLRYSRGVIYHGLSINFHNDLEKFRKINPCGLDGREISSLEELGINYDKDKIIKELKERFIQKFDLNLI